MSQNVEINLSELTPAHRRANLNIPIYATLLRIAPYLVVLAGVGVVATAVAGLYATSAMLFVLMFMLRPGLEYCAAANAKRAAAMNLAWLAAK